MAKSIERLIRELKVLLDASSLDRPVSVDVLQRAVDVSTATIYNDLELLTRLRITRTRGVLQVSFDDPGEARTRPERFSTRRPVKALMADAIVRGLPAGSIVYLDTGSTCYAVAQALIEAGRSDVGIVTPNPYVLGLCAETRVIHDVICLGGVLRAEAASLFGSLTELTLSHVSFDTAILSVDFIHSDENGTLATFSEAEVRQKILAVQRAMRSVVIAVDESKLDRNLGNRVTDLKTIAAERLTSVVVGSDGSVTDDARNEILGRLRAIVGSPESVVCVRLDEQLAKAS